VLGVPDAYSLPAAPGGGYLKVGSTSFERFQASYVSGLDDSGGTVLDAVIDRLSHVDDTVHQIWLPPLEPAVALDRVFPAGFVHDEQRGLAAAAWPGTGTLTVPVGIVDDPSRQRQLPLVLDMAGACGNLAIAGAPQSGKSTLVRSLMLSLAVTHTPEEVQIYGVDLGGGALSALAGLPHVGTIATRLDNDLVRRMIAHIEALLDERERVFTDLGLDSVVAFRARRGEGTLPVENAADVVLVIDGWAAFRERYEHLEPVIADLVSRGLGYGIHVVLTANRWMEVRATVLDSIGGRLELRLNSAIDSNVDRKRAAVIRADQPGRGLHPSTLLFHTALPRLDGVAGTDQLADATAVAVAHITERWSGPCAEPVRLLPTEISIDAISTSPASACDGVLVGLMERKMAPWTLDLSRGEPHFSVYGDGESGRTTFLHTWLDGVVAAQQPEQAQIVLVDYRRTLLDVVPPSHLRAYAASEPATRDVIGELAEVLHDRLPGSDVTAAQLRDRSWWSGPTYYVVIDDYDLVVTASGNPLAPLVPLLAQARDVGLHVVLTRRVAGSSKSAFEPFTSRLREVSPFGLIMAGDRDEGPVLGSVRASPQPPGRGVLVSRRHSPALVQVALPASVPALHLEPAAESVLA
jgi:S-DNA-T family DNA segregation ATPase FtsK/SpoIIIE